MPAALQITPPDGLARLSRAMRVYQRVTGKLASAVLAQKGAQLVYGNTDSRFGAVFPGLHRLFKKQLQPDGRITAAARIRGFRLGRANFASEQTGISATALSRALRIMSGHKIVIGTTSSSADDAFKLTLRTRRLGKRGKRITGGRRGTGGTAVDGSFLGPLPQGEKRLNLRAVATIFELQLREAGRKYLGAAFLFARWRKLAQSDPRRQELGTFRYLAQVNPRAKLQLQAEAELTGDTEGGNADLRITTFVPGVREIGESRSLFSRALDAVATDTEAYLARKVREAAEETLPAA